MTQHKTSCLAAVLVSLYITFMPGGTCGCTDQVSLTSSISGRNACLSEEVTFTCTAQENSLFWRNEAFGEITMHYTSSPTRGEDFRAEIVRYDSNRNCLVSSLSFRATASRNGTTVTCTNRDRSSNRSLSLHIMSNVVLENLAVVPVSLSSVLLEWKVIPTDGYHCISNYSVRIIGPNGSQWEEEIPGSSQSFHFTGLQLIVLQNYTCCVTAKRSHNQLSFINQTLTVELQEPPPPTNLSAVVQCKQGYEIQMDWQAPLLDPLDSPLTGFLLQYQVYDDNITTIEFPALNTSYTLDSVPTDVVYTITVSALSDVGPSRNNPSVQLAVSSVVCEGSLATQSSVVTQISVVTQNTSESTESVDDESSSPLNSITTVITAVTSGVAAFTCILLLAAICFCVIMLRKRTLKKESKSLQCRSATGSKQEERGPHYEEIALQRPHYEEIPVQNYHVYHTLEPNA